MGAAGGRRPGRLLPAGAADRLVDPSRSSSRAVRALFAIRWKLGELLGLDDSDAGVGSRVPTLRDRLPADLRDAPSGPDFVALPFTSLYLIDDEWAAEIANRTMHGVLHIGWVPDAPAASAASWPSCEAQRSARQAYMAAIKPFRYLIVYPAMLREIGRRWRAVGRHPRSAPVCTLPRPAELRATQRHGVAMRADDGVDDEIAVAQAAGHRDIARGNRRPSCWIVEPGDSPGGSSPDDAALGGGGQPSRRVIVVPFTGQQQR